MFSRNVMYCSFRFYSLLELFGGNYLDISSNFNFELILFGIVLLGPLAFVFLWLFFSWCFSFRFKQFFALFVSVVIHLASIGLVIIYQFANPVFSAHVVNLRIVFYRSFLENLFPGYNYFFTIFLGYDQLSLTFVVLSTFLIPICILCSWRSIFVKYDLFLCSLFTIEFFLILTFVSINAFMFYVFFEGVLIPMFLIIGVWGSGYTRLRVRAAYYFLFFTLLGSICILLVLFALVDLWGGFRLHTMVLFVPLFGYGGDFVLRLTYSLSANQQTILFFLAFVGFAVKIPMVPFHIWLPEAHVEAPTAGSVLLAGILLKLGVYGLVRFIPLFPVGAYNLRPFIEVLAVISIVYVSFLILSQTDLKRIIAYSSIIHMNCAILGLFAHELDSAVGSIFSMVSHGLISSALFICVGFLYERYGNRSIFRYGGLLEVMPIFAGFFFLLVLANLGLPSTSSFVGEFLIFAGVVSGNPWLGFLSLFSMFFAGLYNIWLFNRLFLGTAACPEDEVRSFVDLNMREILILFVLVFWVMILGFFPIDFISFILDFFYYHLDIYFLFFTSLS